jgi:hypothetical protein
MLFKDKVLPIRYRQFTAVNAIQRLNLNAAVITGAFQRLGAATAAKTAVRAKMKKDAHIPVASRINSNATIIAGTRPHAFRIINAVII